MQSQRQAAALKMVQAYIIYSGKVQGVGFRVTVQRLAQGLDVSGWVRNLADGRVAICAAGPQERIDQLCRNIDQHFKGYIHGKEIQFSSARESFKDFQITY